MTHAQILLLPVAANPRLILASDNATHYTIAEGHAGADAVALGNANVPADAAILPAQSFVNNATKFFVAMIAGTALDLSSQGITGVAAGASNTDFSIRGFLANAAVPSVDLSGNALTTANVDAILAAAVASGIANGVLDLSGAGMGIPTGGILNANYVTLTGNGWTVTIRTV